jgi:hypothetical protein
MKASRVEFGNPHVYIHMGNMLLKVRKERVTRVNSKQVVVWLAGGRPIVFEL